MFCRATGIRKTTAVLLVLPLPAKHSGSIDGADFGARKGSDRPLVQCNEGKARSF